MLARVAGLEEARIARAAGADIVETAGAAGAGEPDLGALRPFSVAIPDAPAEFATYLAAVRASAGADFIRIALPPEAGDEALRALVAAAPRTRLLAVLPASAAADPALLGRLKRAGFEGAMLDTGEERPGRLLDAMPLTRIAAFVASARGLGLTVGLAGGLEAPDVTRLARLEPDILLFDIPSGGGSAPIALLARLCHGDAPAPTQGAETDLVFIRDFVQEMEVGAYGSERGRRQKIRFTIEAEVRRPLGRPATMAEIYSYDLMMDAVRAIAAREHAEFVEAIAEDLAAAILRDGRVVATLVRVEKLELGPAAAGVEIRRTRA